ncbi:sugar-binding protein [Paenibacillus sp. WC2504]|uniref:sugar-binding protein n=1 Tax=Paenibacillus sp. WC2504 TaxID=3461403 RepID=UPI0040457F7C
MKKMKKIASCITALTLLFSIASVSFPQFSGRADAAETVKMNHTFETTDPNFGAFAVGADIAPVPSMFAVETAFTKKIVSESDGNRALEVTVPADAQGKTRFYYAANASGQATGNRFSFEGSLTFSNQAKEFDLKVIPGDWGQNLPIAKFLPSGDVQVKSGTVAQGTYVKRGTWEANKTYVIKLDLYNDINKYDLFITDKTTNVTTMLASGEPLMAYSGHDFLTTGVVYYNIEAVGTTAATSTSVRYDNIKLSYSNDVRDAYVPAAGTTLLRTTTFETNDTDTSIAGTATGSVILTNILDAKSPSVMKIVEESGSRWVDVTTTQDEPGDIGFPIFQSWAADSIYKSYTLEADFMLKDTNADYYLRLIDGSWGVKSNTLLFSKNGNIYARSSGTGNGAFAARTTWEVNKAFSLKLVVHADTLSYDLYHIKDGKTTRLVNNEPIQNSNLFKTNGLAAMMLNVDAGTHSKATILVDNIKVSASNVAGANPIIHAAPGTLLDAAPVIGTPINYYVSPSGSDSNDGKSASTPFQTIQKAANLTAPGDTVNIMDGLYVYSGGNRMVTITKSGAFNTATNQPAYITYKAAPGAHPVLYSDNAWDVILIQASYIIIDGIEVKGNNQNLTLADGEAAYNYWYEQTQAGLPVNYGDPRFTKANTNGININSGTNLANGLPAFHHITVRNSIIHDLPAGGIGSANVDYITIEDNLVYNNAWYTMYACSGISVLGGVDVDTETGYKSIIRNNIVHHNQTNVKWNQTKGYSDGNGIIIDYNKNTGKTFPAYKGKTLVQNNISYSNGGSGIHSFNSANVDIMNNTLYNNNQNPYLTYAQLFASTSDKVNIFNNIVYSRDLRQGEINYAINNANGSELVIYANNIYYGGGTPKEMGTNDVVADPKFVSLDPTNVNFLRLKSDSPAIDRGTKTLAPSIDIVHAARPQGAKYDIGAYETSYTSANPIVNDVIDIDAIRQTMEFMPENGVARYGTPTIDGSMDPIWNTAPVLNVNKYIDNATAPVTSGATGKVRVLWDTDNLYVLSEVTDPLLSKKNANAWEQDSVEIFLDENNAKTTSHQPDDRQYRINYDNEKTVGSQGNGSEFTSATSKTANGYIVEVKIPFKTIKGSDGKVIGLDSQVNDDNGVGARTSTAIWSDIKGNGYSNTSRWGNVTLLGQVADTTPPTVPGNVQVTDKTHQSANLSWTASTDETSSVTYEVYSGTYKIASGLTGTTYVASNLQPSTAYSFTIRARDAAGNLSGASASAAVTTNAAPVFVQSISVYGNDISTNGGTSQFQAVIVPSAATQATVRWSVYEPDGVTLTNKATINTTGLLKAVKNGSVRVIATSTDGTQISGSTLVAINGQTLGNLQGLSITMSGVGSVYRGASFSTNVGLTSPTNTISTAVYGVDVTVSYDSAHIEFVDTTSLKSGFSFFHADITVPGIVRIYGVATQPSGAITVPGDLFKLNWKAKAPVQSQATVIAVTAAKTSNAQSELSQLAQDQLSSQNVIIFVANTSTLQQLITLAQSTLTQAVEGTQSGQYPMGSKAQLQDQIMTATAVLNTLAATQELVDQAANQLNLAINQFKDGRITTSVYDLGYLVQMAQQYGKAKSQLSLSDWNLVSKYDVNNDNVIDIFDLIVTANLIQ